MYRQLLGSLLLLLCITAGFAQNTEKKYNPRKFKKEPVWITMMNDPDANYYETLKAFRMYWKDRVLPKEPMEREGAETFEKEVGLIGDHESEEEREREERKRAKHTKKGVAYSAQVRAFKGWMQVTKPWVRSDGSIVPEQERQSIIDQQQKELRETELKNGKK